jgi:hypothetical protein
VAKLAEHDTAVSAFYGDGKDRWAYLDMTNSWPKDKGEFSPIWSSCQMDRGPGAPELEG